MFTSSIRGKLSFILCKTFARCSSVGKRKAFCPQTNLLLDVGLRKKFPTLLLAENVALSPLDKRILFITG